MGFSGVLGSGVCILSRFPIQDVMFHKWPLNGYVHKIHHGDWFGGKGVGLCRLKIHDMNVNIYIAHVNLPIRIIPPYSYKYLIVNSCLMFDIPVACGI